MEFLRRLLARSASHERKLVDPSLIEAARIIKELGPTGRVAALTGAGISVPSGIPDFRSRGGLWEKYPPEEYASIWTFIDEPEKVWEMLAHLYRTMEGKEPNAAHFALAELESRNYLAGIVTQNVDSLHQKAGSREVYEYHGSGRELQCITCNTIRPFPGQSIDDIKVPPCCPNCGAIEKPNAVFFGEGIPRDATRATDRLLETCDAWLIIGTSAEVSPASSIPVMAHMKGITVIEFNLEKALPQPTLRVTGDVSQTLPKLVELL